MCISVFSEHDDRSDAGSSGSGRGRGGGARGGYYHNQNRVWTKDGGGGGSKKSVSFKDRGGGIKKRLGPKNNQNRNLARFVIGEDDQDMDGAQGASSSNAGRARPHIRGGFKPRRGGRGAVHIPGNAVAFRKGRSSSAPGKSWHKIQINSGSKYSKEELLPTIQNACPTPFSAIAFGKTGPHTVFYVESVDVAEALKKLNDTIVLSDGKKLSLSANRSPPPMFNSGPIVPETLEKLKQAMSDGYKTDTKALVLTKFYANRHFHGDSAYVSLARSQFMREVVKVVGEHIRDVSAIELSENKISLLDALGELTSKAPNVTILYLHNNSIRDVSEFEKIKGWKLKEMNVKGNPFISKFSEASGYHR